MVNEKIKKIEKFNHGIKNCKVILSKENNGENVDIIAHGKGYDFVARENGDNFERALISAIEKITIQVKKQHDKVVSH